MSGIGRLARKELRALFGAWLIVAASMLVGELPGLHEFRELAILAYIGGAAALGALSIGHEYRYGTLSQLLAQPASRTRVLAVKIAALTVLLAGLAAGALMFPLAHAPWIGTGRTALVTLPMLYGVSVAPWITIKTRNVIAGTLFTGSLGGFLFVGSYYWAFNRSVSPEEIEALRLAFIWTGSALVCAAGAWGVWTAFRGLEVSDGPRAELHFFSAPDAGTARQVSRGVRHPLLHLVAKELRLQQLTFAASLLYVVGCILTSVTDLPHLNRGDVLTAISVIHAIVIAAMAGALSCAEERALGTHEWQLLQPMAARTQFAIKLGVVVALTLALAFGLPFVLMSVTRGVGTKWPPDQWVTTVSAILWLAAGSMYISSVAGSGLTALLLCIPAFIAVKTFMAFVVMPIAGRVFVYMYRLPNGSFVRHISRVPEGVNLLIVFGFIMAALWLAFRNHRETGRSPRQAFVQLAALAAVIAAIYTAFGAAGHPL